MKLTIDKKFKKWILDAILILVLVVAAYFRLVGINWGEEQYLHPDERFLVWVGSDISPVNDLSEYFDTANSSLNPHNRGHGFFVYGTLPLFVARYLVEWIFGHSGFNEMTLVGRPLSALADLLTLVLVYLIAKRLYHKRVAILASVFYAFAVLPIQLSHFYKEDTFTNLFVLLVVYFAVRIYDTPWENDHYLKVKEGERVTDPDPGTNGVTLPDFPSTIKTRSFFYEFQHFISNPLFVWCVLFGFSLGCAVASKLTAVPVAILLPAAFTLRLYNERFSIDTDREGYYKHLQNGLLFLLVAAFVSLLVFRLFQPYAFRGPGFMGVRLNPAWVANIREQRSQSTGDVDFPPALQWARRSKFFSLNNIVLWGLGLPLGLLSWVGFLWAGWQILKGNGKRHILIWGWATLYFLWQSSLDNPTMRYQLPVYPILAIFAGWLLVEIYQLGKDRKKARETDLPNTGREKQVNWLSILAIGIGTIVIVTTFSWAFSFTRIYTRPISRIAASRWIFQNVPGPINLQITGKHGLYNQPIPVQENIFISPALSFSTIFTANEEGTIKDVLFNHIADLDGYPTQKTLEIRIKASGEDSIEAKSTLISDFLPVKDGRGESYTGIFKLPLQVEKGKSYKLEVLMLGGNGDLVISGSAPANESSWDDGLPVRIDGYDGYGGIYQPGLNFEMYWDDNTEKLLKMLHTLEQSDYIFISSNRQWGTTTRVPERYPLTSAYYRALLGCPEEKELLWCYRVAEVGMFHGELGFELIQVFRSYPNLGPLEINDQFAEEAFTVYDHPKVFIFKKSTLFDIQAASDLFRTIDLEQVLHLTPKQVKGFPGSLLLPSWRWLEQRAGGTWSDLFNTEAWINQSQIIAAVVWYLCLCLLGLIVYPSVRMIFSGLPDGGYPFIRIVGLLVLSYLVWLAGSMRIPFTRTTISLMVLLLVFINGYFALKQRQAIKQEWNNHKRYYLVVEGLFLILFILDLLIRFGNPDLWHPWKGGEKPMDFAYFNAVLKSTSFPPYDPWYAGGYLNYYYYGFVLMGVPVKWLGIMPSLAYNLIIPSVFAMIGMGAFSLGWNIFSGTHKKQDHPTNPSVRYLSGGAGLLCMALLGNLGTVRMVFRGFQQISAPGGVTEGAGIFTKWAWALRGFFEVLSGKSLPFGIGDWYWNSSRVIAAPNEVEPITEFPFFTVLYADLHAHLFSLPIALLVIAFGLSLVFVKKDSIKRILPLFGLGGLAIGALRPTNTWDFYTYLCLGCVVSFFALWSYQPEMMSVAGRTLEQIRRYRSQHNTRRILTGFLGVLLLIGLAIAFFYPYTHWYAQGYSHIDLWRGTKTSFSDYLTHWGLFLFVIISWMWWESFDWMATTPVSALRKLLPYKNRIYFFLGMLFLLVIVITLALNVGITWFVFPLAAWAGILILRPGQDAGKRFVCLLIGTGFILTLMVEVIVLRGDIARMNTVFKFYLQVWTFFAISTAACLGWLVTSLSKWKAGWRNIWQVALIILVASAALYPLLAGIAKVKDRMAMEAPHTLDGMVYMQYAHYTDTWGDMDLSQDYRAIRWMQENVVGSPVIVEANLRDLYRWGSRFSNYTGLPGVVGWEWHQQQQKAILPGNWISSRIDEVDEFYTTLDFYKANEFIQKYEVRYIILGQQERGHYPGPGLDKFEVADGVMWREVYREGQTVIYEVLEQQVENE